MECVRRSVPNDNSCLFYAVAYLVDGPDAVSDSTQKELRRVCADAATAEMRTRCVAAIPTKPVMTLDDGAPQGAETSTMHPSSPRSPRPPVDGAIVVMAVRTARGVDTLVLRRGLAQERDP